MSDAFKKQRKLVRKYQRKIFWLGFWKIPMLHYTRPKLLLIDEEHIILKIKLRRRTKNHLRSMYFGALCVGADIGAGVFTLYHADLQKLKISFAFKSMSVQFVQRAESHVRFICKDGDKLKRMIADCKETGKRQNQVVAVEALNESNELVATFMMEASAKGRK